MSAMKSRSIFKSIKTCFICVSIAAAVSGCATDKVVTGQDPVPEMPVINIEDDRTFPAEPDMAENEAKITDAPAPDEDVIPTPEESFYAEEIGDEVFGRMQGKSFPEGCTTKREDLRYLHLLYKDMEGNTHEGEMVCNVSIADDLIGIFRQLYDADYPIEKMRLIDDYGGDDDASMADNNTSCFNYRIVSDTSHLSNHAYGLAVDLNPLYNPYIRQKGGATVVEPPEGEAYADRTSDFSYKIDKDDLAYKLFTDAGFKWGGSWKSVKDYQHFEKP